MANPVKVYPITLYVKAESKEDAQQLNQEMKTFYEFDALMLRAIKAMALSDPKTFRGVIRKGLNGDMQGAIAAITEKAMGGFSIGKLMGKK